MEEQREEDEERFNALARRPAYAQSFPAYAQQQGSYRSSRSSSSSSSAFRGLAGAERRDVSSMKSLIRRKFSKKGDAGVKGMIRRDFSKMAEDKKINRLAGVIGNLKPEHKNALVAMLRASLAKGKGGLRRAVARDERAARREAKNKNSKARELNGMQSAVSKLKNKEKNALSREARKMKSEFRAMEGGGVASKLQSLMRKVRRDGKRGIWGKKFAGLESNIRADTRSADQKKRDAAAKLAKKLKKQHCPP